MSSRLGVVVMFAGLALPASAQRVVTLHGIAYDSLHATPLNGAFVVVSGSSRSSISDSNGRFAFDSVVPGTYRLVMQHDVLDSIGMSGATARVTVTDGRDTVRIAVPSFTTMWRAVCPSTNPPADSGMVFGTIRAPAREKLARGSKVTASWIDMAATGKTTVKQQRWRFETPIDSLGNYTLCGVPLSTGIRLWAASDSGGSAFVDVLPLNRTRIARRDLLLASSASDSTARGTIVGTVTGYGDKPLSDAQVIAEGVPDSRTDRGGEFIIRNVPIGTQQIEVRAIGLQPVFQQVDVTAGDTAHVSVRLGKVNVLDSVRVNERSTAFHYINEYEYRKTHSIGHFLDSTIVGNRGTLGSVFAEVPSVVVRMPRAKPPVILLPSSLGNGCLANIFIDGVKVDQSLLDTVHPDEVAAIEVYVRRYDVPADFLVDKASTGCGTIAIWNKRKWR
jgi:hypothetical protein